MSSAARPHLVYVSGEPGIGKSTLMAALTDGCDRRTPPTPEAADVALVPPVPHDELYAPGGEALLGIELGRRREAFSGTDALSMAIQPKALDWLAHLVRDRPHRYRLVLGEGDRLGNMKFLACCEQLPMTVTLVHLHAPRDVVQARHAGRGSAQNPKWRAGRRTKAARLADHWEINGGTLLRLDASAPPAELVERVRSAVPALDVLPRACGGTGVRALAGL